MRRRQLHPDAGVGKIWLQDIEARKSAAPLSGRLPPACTPCGGGGGGGLPSLPPSTALLGSGDAGARGKSSREA
eukprot:15459200-Alexandrium_andersonii.AAC.1